MKILPVNLIREADVYTIRHEPIADIDLMERAASQCAGWLKDHVDPARRLKVFCGPGNNGGDGFAIARRMAESGYRVEVFHLGSPEKMSPSCLENFRRFKGNHPLCKISELSGNEHTSELFPDEPGPGPVLIDALFGSGLTRLPEEVPAKIIRLINESLIPVISIDIPSGLFCDEPVENVPDLPVIRACHTLTFSPPKLAFFFPASHRFTGEWHLLDIGLHPDFLATAAVRNFMTEERDILAILKPRSKFAHKGSFGHALLICGSGGKSGAAVLAARACTRSGPGLVTVHIPRGSVDILQSSVPEAMASIDSDADRFTVTPQLHGYTSIAAGPGLGTHERTATALKLLIQQAGIPMIFDADAINILAMNPTWLAFLPAGCIFTPHMKEFERLAGKSSNDFDRNQRQRDFSFRYQCYVVLKGAHTAITTPEGICWFNTTGNPGMATGGSGDVLTGILAGLMARGYSPAGACLLGVYIHGLAGDLAAMEKGMESLVASDIIDKLGNSFLALYGKL